MPVPETTFAIINSFFLFLTMNASVTDFVFMRKIVSCFFFLIISLRPSSIVAQVQTPGDAVGALKEEQYRFHQYLNYLTFDPNIISRLSRFVDLEADSISRRIVTDTALTDDKKVKAIQSLAYFLRELGGYIIAKKIDTYAIPDALESYKGILKALVYHTSFADLLIPLGPVACELLASSFWQYDECALLDDIAIYKQVASLPGYILHYLERYPAFRFADSLLLIAAAYDPLKISSFVIGDRTDLAQNILINKNIYLQQIVSLTADRNASELLPFLIPLAEKRIATEEILNKRMEVTSYFQLLVNTLRNEVDRPADSSLIFQVALRNAVKEKALYFYVNRINELHSSAEAIRFACVKNLRLEDLYYIITSCEEELYTSSYLGLYGRLMKYLTAQTADSIFRLVHYDNFRIFIRMAANYNTLADFLSCMSQEKAAELLMLFISGIESDKDSGLEKAMGIADSYTGLSSTGISEVIRKGLQSNLDRCQTGQLFFGIRLYSILLQTFDLVKQKDSLNNLWEYLGNHEMLQRKSLQNENGEIVELVLFYGDEDGITSFSNFLNLFKDEGKWEVSKNEFWVTIRSLSEEPIIIYANQPLDNNLGMDMQAQDSLSVFLTRQSAYPVILIHRGHSYHLSKSLRRLQPTVKLAILGSCGGYSDILRVTDTSPDAQIIVSKKTGSKFINDPMIDVIHETLQNKNDLIWTEVWEKLVIRFRNDKFSLDLFNDYIPPGKNVSQFVLKLFNS
ncbi:MAG TPA: hypothetical protein VFT15_02340, partial [Chitinophagaceae bacterium]|nr:hypothetical protein [Chitinophagaceae bacterium]